MIVEIITCWYNEKFLAPFFLNHYSWADRITILVVGPGDYIKPDPKIKCAPLEMPLGMDDGIKAFALNKWYRESSADWVILPDADEFVFAGRVILKLAPKKYDVLRVHLDHVYRHLSEADLDPSKPIMDQRRHGYHEALYDKPIVARGGRNFTWGVGNHSLKGNAKFSPFSLLGAHWANADPCFCVQRRVRDRSQRMSPRNLSKGWTSRQWNLTEEAVLKECGEHANDSRLW